MKKVRLPRYVYRLVLFFSVLLLFVSCDHAITLPSFLQPKPPTKSKMLTALSERIEGISEIPLRLDGEDFVFTLTKRTTTVSSYVGTLFNSLASFADPNTLTIYIDSKSYTSPTEAASEANTLAKTLDPATEELPYRATFKYKNTPFELKGELVFQDLYIYMGMSKDEWNNWYAERTGLPENINGKPVIYLNVGDEGISEYDPLEEASTYIRYVDGVETIIKVGSVSIGRDDSTLYTIEDALA